MLPPPAEGIINQLIMEHNAYIKYIAIEGAGAKTT